MQNDLITVDSILDWLKACIEQKMPVDAHQWVEAALRLNVLVVDEHDMLFTMQQAVSKKRVELLEGGKNATQAKMIVEASDEYRLTQSQKARIGRIEELVRIAKVQARLKDAEMRLN